MNNVILPLSVGDQGRLVEKRNEERFERIMNQRPFPCWYYGVRPGTPEEDRRRIDFVAELDVVEVPLQIKSSLRGREKHIRKEHKHRPCVYSRDHAILCVIVCDAFSDDVIRAQTMQILAAARERFFAREERFSRETRR